MDRIVKEIIRAVEQKKTPENMINGGQFEKGSRRIWVLKTPVVRKIAKEHFARINQYPKKEIFEICEQLLQSGQRMVAFEFALWSEPEYKSTDFARFEKWLKKYVTGWGSCDHLCCGALGHLLHMFPELYGRTLPWTSSRNLWQRRAAAVVQIYPVEKGSGLKNVFEIADLLLMDNEDMVQKGYGWMLKVASNKYPDDVLKFVLDRKETMPRTALRYAIEKLPQAMRAKAMEK